MRRVLIVDDEDDIREVAQLSLELLGPYDVLTAASGRAGVEVARANQPDAILLDVTMPDMDGPATLAELRADPSTCDIPVLFLTAQTHSSERTHLATFGVAGILTKPFDPLKLANEVAAALGWS